MPRNPDITLPDDFASTMQQLVAEAEQTIAPRGADDENEPAQSEDVRREFAAMNERMAALERMISNGFEKLSGNSEVVEQLASLDAQMTALRNADTLNQRLFNSLHAELKSYRDNFLRESLQKPFIRDLVMLFDDLSSLANQMQSSDGAQGAVGRWSSNLENAVHALVEILHRMEVSEIEPKEMVDRQFHRVISYEPADFAEDDGRIVMRLKRGFIWRDQVLRPEEVVAKRFE
ncbi:MAG: nucleotide exchange factor GrpE [Verrucomicrobiota bacterium]|nr:nucleotide exchange factor GrpE [Verrucomicrobiota bacterium]